MCLSYDKFGRWDKDCKPKLQNKAKLASKNNEQIKSISQNIGLFKFDPPFDVSIDQSIESNVYFQVFLSMLNKA